jgi:hypothetical protein
MKKYERFARDLRIASFHQRPSPHMSLEEDCAVLHIVRSAMPNSSLKIACLCQLHLCVSRTVHCVRHVRGPMIFWGALKDTMQRIKYITLILNNRPFSSSLDGPRVLLFHQRPSPHMSLEEDCAVLHIVQSAMPNSNLKITCFRQQHLCVSRTVHCVRHVRKPLLFGVTEKVHYAKNEINCI